MLGTQHEVEGARRIGAARGELGEVHANERLGFGRHERELGEDGDPRDDGRRLGRRWAEAWGGGAGAESRRPAAGRARGPERGRERPSARGRGHNPRTSPKRAPARSPVYASSRLRMDAPVYHRFAAAAIALAACRSGNIPSSTTPVASAADLRVTQVRFVPGE